jgi:hypothetical protein
MYTFNFIFYINKKVHERDKEQSVNGGRKTYNDNLSVISFIKYKIIIIYDF